jgi:hypothetical protein
MSQSTRASQNSLMSILVQMPHSESEQVISGAVNSAWPIVLS